MIFECTPVAIYAVIAVFICCVGFMINVLVNKSYDIINPIGNLSSICLYAIFLAIICTLSPTITWIIVLVFICCNFTVVCGMLMGMEKLIRST